MRIVIAPDSYKGSVSALGVAQAMERGIRRVFPDAEISLAPIADGGDGTVEALVTATGGQFCQTVVTGPLGERVTAQWGILGDGVTAVIEMAAASGLPLVSPDHHLQHGRTDPGGPGSRVAPLDYWHRRQRGISLIVDVVGSSERISHSHAALLCPRRSSEKSNIA